MLWRTDAFQAAGLDPPGAHWTLIEFHQACTALEGLAASGRLPGLKSALGPIVSSPAPRYPPAPGNNGLDALSSPGLWQAFAWGFGGPIATADGFRLTDAATVAGMQALVDLIREFAPVQPAPPGSETTSIPVSTAYAISFALFGVKSYVSRSGTPLQPPFAYARLPQFPVTPVIPVVPFGWCLNRAANARPLAPDAPLISAAVEFVRNYSDPPRRAGRKMVLDGRADPLNHVPWVQERS